MPTILNVLCRPCRAAANEAAGNRGSGNGTVGSETGAPEMPAPESQAKRHARVREAHETELIEDYVELIGDLQQSVGEARAADLARRLGVSHATVHNMLRRLVELGLVTKAPYRAVFLTGEGARWADESRRRHDIVLAFLRAAGVSEATAQQDAEGIEHHVSDETLDILHALSESLKQDAPSHHREP